MAAFTDEQIDWSRIEVGAIVGHHGVAVIDMARRTACLEWLQKQDCRIEQLDCTTGIKAVLKKLDVLFRWEEQFGYSLSEGSRNLNALRDGFEFQVPSGGLVFELFQPDVIWHDDSNWLLGLLAIASEHSRYHLACGRRFFTLLVLPDGSPLIGQKFAEISVPYPFWNPCDEIHRFVRSAKQSKPE
jgi:hypothetical protein